MHIARQHQSEVMTYRLLSSVFHSFLRLCLLISGQKNREAIRTDSPCCAEHDLQFQHHVGAGMNLSRGFRRLEKEIAADHEHHCHFHNV